LDLELNKPEAFRSALLGWFDANQRDLPWRRTKDPYCIWISEIMLQQTRVAAVIAYYERFLARLPDVRSLAAAEESEVLALWSGLGYYRRARMLHAAAKAVVAEYGGAFPATAEGLRKLPGIGRYTAAAIASISFGEPVGVVDGNVERVLARMTGAALSDQQCWAEVARLIDPQRPGDFNQAMMELGATVCTPKSPQCLVCPVQRLCRTRGVHPTAPQAERKAGVLRYALRTRAGQVQLTQRSASERLMPSMWELPASSESESEPLYRLKHSITNTDYEVLVFSSSGRLSRGCEWVSLESVHDLPLTGLSRKILKKAKLLQL
jgi:A/G-specific adenine glycosylase